MVVSVLRERWTRAGRQARRSSRGKRNAGLGWMFGVALLGTAVMYLRSSEDAEAALIAGEGAGAPSVAAGAGHGRALASAEFFKTTPEQCAGTESWWSAPFFAITLYSFVGLAVITDEYFEPTLALISDDLGLSPDVAGATFMAAGSSAPELLTSMVDAFFSKASVGVGTILGSAMFNLLVIVGGTAIVGKAKDGGPLVIQGYPLGRDSLFYLMSLAVLTGVMLNDGKLCVMRDDRFDIYNNRTDQNPADALCYVGLVTPMEGLLLTLFYVTYIIFMMYNQSIHTWFNENIQFRCCSRIGKPTNTKPSYELSGLAADLDKHTAGQRRDSWGGDLANDPEQTGPPGRGAELDGEDEEDHFEDDEEEFPGNPCSREIEGLGGAIWYFLAFPYFLIFFVTMPTWLPNGRCRNFLLFIVNIAYITGLTLAMVYFATFGGCLLGVDPFIIGIIFLAIGTSVPDALASFIVARDGHGDMAISNALGSNVFDILLGLGLPWFASGLAFPEQVNAPEGRRGGQFVVTNGVVAGMLMLVIGLFLFVGSLICFNWRMLKPIAFVLVAYYAAFLTLIILANSCQLPICIELDCSRCGFEPAL